MTSDLPLISCLCVTHKKKEPLIRAINCFLAQTYSRKELILIYEEGDLIARSVLDKYKGHDEIHISEVDVKPKKSLGALRNISVAKANGQYFCQWDDDDWYSDYRLEEMYQNSDTKKSVLLNQWFIYNEQDGQSYLSNKRTWEGSMLYHIDVSDDPEYYSDKIKGEDTTLIDRLIAEKGIKMINAPYLYIYTYTGDNTWDNDHWSQIFNASSKLSEDQQSEVRNIMNGAYDHYESSFRLRAIHDSIIYK